jgi:hypothetical protein
VSFWFRYRGAPLLAACVALSLLLNFAYLFSGFQADDLIFLNMRKMTPLPYPRWFGFWAAPLESYECFQALWWMEEGAAGKFLRPLPSLVIEGSVELFGETAFPLHLLSLVLHGVVGFTVFRLFSRITGGRAVPLLAALFYLGCEDHSMGVGWIATITDMLCVGFINLALLLHLDYRESGRRRDLLASLGCMALAFGSKETAALAPAAVVTMELLLPEQLPLLDRQTLELGARPALRRWLGRARYWVPAAAITLAYLVLYRLGGFGVTALMYLNPMTQPLAYLHNLALGLPVMALAAVTLVPPSLGMFMPHTLVALAVAGVVLAVLLAWGLRPMWREPTVLLCAAMFVIALLPQLATTASERLLYFPMVFGSYLLARLTAEAGPLARRIWPDRKHRAPLVTRAWAWSLAAGTLLPGLVMSAIMPWEYARQLDLPKQELQTAVGVVQARHPDSVIVLNTSGMFMTFYAGETLQYLLGRRLPVHVLSSANARMSIQRVSARSFVLEADRQGWLGNMFALVVRSNPELELGREYPGTRFTATLLGLTPDRRDALRVRFDFNSSLEDSPSLLLSWDGDCFVSLDFASLRNGERRILADTSDVLAMLLGD